MNILGFISALLLMLVFFFVALMGDFFDLSEQESSYLEYQEASRSAQSAYETAYYKSFRNPPKKKEETSPSQKEIAAKEKSKEEKWENMPECARFNLFPLLQAGQDKSLEQRRFFLALLQTLYGDNLLENLAPLKEKILEAILSPSQETSSPFYLAQLKIEDRSLQSLFYHMLKGSSVHYKSLLEYVKINPEEPNEKICLACADEKMLSALFGEKAARRLCSEKEHSLEKLQITKNRLEEILREEEQPSPQESIWNLVRFTHPSKKQGPITVSSQDSDITVKKKGFIEGVF